MFKKLLLCSLVFSSITSFASTGFIQHKIINKTNQDFDFILRQIYSRPLFGCFEHVAANSEKTCSGEFDNNKGFFIFDFFSKTPSETDWHYTYNNWKIAGMQNVSMTWTIVKVKNDYELQVKVN